MGVKITHDNLEGLRYLLEWQQPATWRPEAARYYADVAEEAVEGNWRRIMTITRQTDPHTWSRDERRFWRFVQGRAEQGLREERRAKEGR